MAIVVSLIADDFDLLAASALGQAPLADLVEVRLDRIGHPGQAALRRLARECPKPLIVTVHGAEAFGTFTGSVDERCQLLADAAGAGARFVDVDYTLSLALGEVEAPCHRIVSRHDVEGTPEDLAAFDEEVRAVLYEGDAVKLVTHATCTEDGLRLLRHLRRARGGLIAFCSGPAGSFTRVLAPIFGSPFTYAAPASGAGPPDLEPSAPGQLPIDELLGILPPGGAGPETAVLGVVGRPIAHSASPFVHGMALKHAHLDAVYVAFEPRDFDRFLDLADDGNFRGLSVTAPFKQRALARAASADEPAAAVGAANTLVRDGQGWRGFNTDLVAARETFETLWPVFVEGAGEGLDPPTDPATARVLVLGAGGAARAVVGGLKALGLRPTLAARRTERAQALADELACDALAWGAIPSFPYHALVNCTPVGGGGGGSGGGGADGSGDGSGADSPPTPIPPHWIRTGSLVIEAVYRPMVTPLLAAARQRGCVAVPGGEWFVRQALAQLRLFTRSEPDEALVRAAFEGALHQPRRDRS